jgi:ribosomal protein L35
MVSLLCYWFVVVVVVVLFAIPSKTHVIPNLALLSLFRNKAGKRHNTGHKGRARVNRLSASAPITEKSIEKRMRRLIAA